MHDEEKHRINQTGVWTKYQPQPPLNEAEPPRPTPPVRRPHSRRRRRRLLAVVGIGAAAAVLVVTLIGIGLHALIVRNRVDLDSIVCPAWIEPHLIDLDGAARPGTPLEKVNDLAIHYVGNPNTTAIANRNYFNQPTTEVSSHFIVGLEGEIVQCVPLNERSVATNNRNSDTISIEVCHPDESGRFNDKTYASLIKLCAWLCQELHLDETHLIRHYDVTGKSCPLYYVVHEDAWEQLKEDVGRYLEEHKEIT